LPGSQTDPDKADLFIATEMSRCVENQPVELTTGQAF
jgi:hypothetical protein